MANVTQLLSVTLVLCSYQLISGYSFENCIAVPYSRGKFFQCIRRQETNISKIVTDLPSSVVNLTISINPLWHIPSNSFARLPNLQHLRIDHNHLRVISQSAFHNLHQLNSLNLSFNNISALSSSVFEDLRNLSFLSLAHNYLKQLPEGIFSPVINLETLLMRENFLTNFSGIARSVSNLTNLKLLDLCFNRLTSLTHSNVSLPKSLTNLYLCRNNLSRLGCKPSLLRFIKFLDLSYNSQLFASAFQGLDLGQIIYLRLRSTSVKVVEFLHISNVNASHVDYSGTDLSNNRRLKDLCKMLKTKMKWIENLNLGSNRIRTLTNVSLHHCPDITGTLDLSRNELKWTNCLHFLNSHRNIQSFDAEHNHFTSLPTCRTKNFSFANLEELSYRYNRILSVNAYAFHHTPNIKQLKLNINTIAFLHREALKGLERLETLRLDNNLLTDLFNDTFEDNINLQILNLRNNRISVIFNRTFLSLSNLTSLDLGGNKITHIDRSGLVGLKSLLKFYLDGNNLKQIDPFLFRAFQHKLTVLDLQSNQIRFLNEKPIMPPFVNLTKLSDLKLDGQRPYGLTVLPRNFFQGLRSLKSLYLTNNNIVHLPPDAFDDLTALHFLTLDNCCVGAVNLQPGVFKNLRNLTKLIVENMGMQNFSEEVFGNLTKLRMLQLNRNVMQSIPVKALESLPNLHYLDIRNIPLSCTCKNKFLQNWTINNTKVQIVYLYTLPCERDGKIKFSNFDTKVCYIDLGLYLFLSTAAVIFLFTVTPLLYVKLYWKMKYSYYVFRAWFSEQWRNIREEEENCKYDAFISYNSSDEQWVMDQLLPNLEGNGSAFKLCLHHRDFELGRYIVDNIVSAVYSSRKTVCVVSRNFLQSEWCSLEIQLASYRLFDEHRDVLLLVFLEPISERQLSSYHRMRKVMLKKTYLQWPGTDCTDPAQARDLFWNQLRRAMRTGSKLKTEENQQGEGCVATESEDTEHVETSDENYYLLP